MDTPTLLTLLGVLLVALVVVWLLLPHPGTYAAPRSDGPYTLTIMYRDGRTHDREPQHTAHDVEETAEDWLTDERVAHVFITTGTGERQRFTRADMERAGGVCIRP